MDDVQMTEIATGGPSGTAEVSENTNLIVANVGGCYKAYNGITPYVGLEFNTVDEAYDYYNLYAQDKGFGIRKEGLDKSRKPTKEVLSRTFVCNKAGIKRVDKREFGKLVNRRPDTRVNCTAGMKIKLTDSNTWMVSKFTEEHKNHNFTSPDKVLNHYSHKRMHRTKSCKTLMSKLSGQGLPPATIARVLNAAGGSGDELITSQQCSDHIRTVRKNNIGIECISVIKNFQDRRATDPDFYFAMEVYNDGTMRSIFWADGRSRSTYLRLGDVVVFDVTYRTNHLSLPFAPFTGVNHHRQSTLFGCALLADEQEDTFVWLFTEWLQCMNGIAPKSIITDQDGRIVEAIKKVFPNSHHRFCDWHISKHIGEHLVQLKLQHGEEFPSSFYRWFEAKTIDLCEQNWKVMKEKYEINENGVDWVPKMYRQRKHWVDAYMKDIFWAGMTTSQRSESINAFFDSYVNSKTQIPEFVEQYDKAIIARRASESQEDFMTLNSKPTVTLPHPIDVQASKVYTRCMLKLFQKELVDGLSLFHEEVTKEGLSIVYKVGSFEENKDTWEEVTYDQNGELKVTCSCAMFETDGYLCKHILHIMHNNQLRAIPDRYILHRWTIGARHRNIGSSNVMNVRNYQSSEKQYTTLKLWAIRAKFNSLLEIIPRCDFHLSKLEAMLENCIISAEKEISSEEVVIQAPEHCSQVSTSSPLLVSQVPETTIRDPTGPVKTKGRPRAASRFQSGLQTSQKKKEIKPRKCGYCGELRHYITSCPQFAEDNKKKQVTEEKESDT